MKRLLAFVLTMMAVAMAWNFSMPFMLEKMSVLSADVSTEYVFSGISSLFSSLALASMVFIICAQALDAKNNQQKIEKTFESNRRHLEVIALSSLINECDTTLHRYDRWEKAGIKGDYTNAKADVREKMNAYRTRLEQTYDDIQHA